LKSIPNSALPAPLLDKSNEFLEQHSLPNNESLVITCAALIREISKTKSVRSKQLKRQSAADKRNSEEFFNRIIHLKKEYWAELRYFGLSEDDIEYGIKWAEHRYTNPYRAHQTLLMYRLLIYFFQDLTDIDIKATAQWKIAVDLFEEFSTDDVNASDYEERIKWVYNTKFKGKK